MILEICAVIIATVEILKIAIKCIEINELYKEDPPLDEEIAKKIYS